MIGMGGTNGEDGRRRQRLVAGLVVLAMVLAAGAVVFSILLS